MLTSLLQAIVAIGLGLSVQWAPSNYGTDNPYGLGNCYRWGEWPTVEDGWRVPTAEEFDELMELCTWEWHQGTQDIPAHYVVTGPSGERIILPAAGYISGEKTVSAGKWGYLWSSSRDDLMESDGRGITFGGSGQYRWYSGSTNFQFPIRLVRPLSE